MIGIRLTSTRPDRMNWRIHANDRDLVSMELGPSIWMADD
jgi:hypothetical protein